MKRIPIKQQFENIWKLKTLKHKRTDRVKMEAYLWFLDGYGCAVLDRMEEKK